jgi:excisionase family DNA binding protein
MEIYRSQPAPAPEPLLVSTRVAAKMLSVCERTISNLSSRGDLRPIRIGKAVRFAVEDLKMWIRKHAEENSKNLT